jgi:putative transcriptional regulator
MNTAVEPEIDSCARTSRTSPRPFRADAEGAIPQLRESPAEMAADERRRTHTSTQISVRYARAALNPSQPAFARLIDTPAGSLRD